MSLIPRFNRTSSPALFSNDTLVPQILVAVANSVISQSHESGLPSRNLNGYLNYLVSPYASVCMLMAIILNRTIFLASLNPASRRNVPRPESWLQRLGAYCYPGWIKVELRLITVALLLVNVRFVLVALNCYSGFAHRYLSRTALFDYLATGPLTAVPYNATTAKLLYNGTVTVGKNGNLQPGDPNFGYFGPSSDLLWPLYLSLCFSQFVETFCSITSGVQPSIETSITLFELSIAFYEFNNMLGGYELPSPELLALCLSSLANHLSIHVLKVCNRIRYRLKTSTAIGGTFLAYYIYTFFAGRIHYFPAVVVLSFFPTVVKVVIIGICCVIYFAASALNESHMTFENLGVENLNVSSLDDFNAALFKVSVLALTNVSKKSYIKELSNIELPQSTWFEAELRNLHKTQQANKKRTFRNAHASSYSNFLELPADLAELMEQKQDDPDSSSSSWAMVTKFTNTSTVVKVFFTFLYSAVFKRKQIQLLQRKNELLRSKLQPDDSVDFYSDSKINYSRLLTGPMASETDNTSDFEDIDDDDNDYEDYEDDDDNAILEVIEAQDIYSLLTNKTEEQQILRSHLAQPEFKRLTRSQYTLETNEFTKFGHLLLEVRELTTAQDQPSRAFSCVICQTNPRQIVLWPCRCLALCDSCRLSLVLRSFNTCVCCRQDIEGYSKIYMP